MPGAGTPSCSSLPGRRRTPGEGRRAAGLRHGAPNPPPPGAIMNGMTPEQQDSKTQGPVDPFTPTQEGLASIYEMFLGLRTAGASLVEAAAIIGGIVAAQGRAG